MTQNEIDRKKVVLSKLALQLKEKNTADNEVYLYAKAKNQWFTIDFIQRSMDAIIDFYLSNNELQKWLSAYDLSKTSSKKIGIIVAGNIPLVGIHDILCAYFTSHQILVKLSSKDDVLMTYFFAEWALIDPDFSSQFTISESLKNIDAIIATGSNTTHQYFEHYFKNIPQILRKNRNSIAVLSGDETSAQLQALTDDVFNYFGLGCRNVSLIFVPKDYPIISLFTYFDAFEYLRNHVKYMNNYDYNRTLLLMNQIPHLSSDYLILEEKTLLSSRLATLHYAYYEHIDDVNKFIDEQQDQIQCVVSSHMALRNASIPFGQSQHPTLSDYSDNIDTLQFLINL